MGRTAPPARVLVEGEVERLRRLARRLPDPADRRILEELLGEVESVLPAYRHVAMSDPLEPVLLALILATYKSCRGEGKRRGLEGVPPGKGLVDDVPRAS